MRIRTHLMVTYSALAIIPLVLFGLLLYSNTRLARIKDAERELATVAQLADNNIDFYYQDIAATLALAPEILRIESFLRLIGEQSPSMWSSNHQDAVAAMNASLASFKKADSSVAHAAIANARGVVVYIDPMESPEEELGGMLTAIDSSVPYDGTAIAFGTIQYEKQSDELSQHVFVPIRNDTSFLGTLIVKLNGNHLIDFTQASAVSGSSRELVLVAAQGTSILFLTPLLNGSQIGVEEYVIGSDRAIPAQQALKGIEGTVIGRDYRGIPVIASTRFNKNLRIGIISKMDIDELNLPLRAISKASLGLGIVALPLLLLIALVYATQLSTPLRHLRWHTEHIAHGDFSEQPTDNAPQPLSELSELHASFVDMAVQVAAIDQAKTDLISIAAHQLRTPLASLNWYAELLASENTAVLSPLQQTAINEISASSRHLSDLVSSMLEVSRADMNKLTSTPQSTLIAPLVEQSVKEILAAATVRGVAIEVDVTKDTVLCVDPKLFGMIISNLVGNGVKYTPDGGHVSLHITRTQDSGCDIVVTDTGIGIPDAEQPNLFTKMYRASNAVALQDSGTGLGLYLVKKIVELLRGTIEFKSRVNHGTTFTVHLPNLTGCENV